MKTQHAKGVTHIANQARHHTSQIARIEDKLSNIDINAAKREVRLITFILGATIGTVALATTILSIQMSMLD